MRSCCVAVGISIVASAVLSFLGAYALLVWAPEGILDKALGLED